VIRTLIFALVLRVRTAAQRLWLAEPLRMVRRELSADCLGLLTANWRRAVGGAHGRAMDKPVRRGWALLGMAFSGAAVKAADRVQKVGSGRSRAGWPPP